MPSTLLFAAGGGRRSASWGAVAQRHAGLVQGVDSWSGGTAYGFGAGEPAMPREAATRGGCTADAFRPSASHFPPLPRTRLVWVEIGMMCTLLLMGLWQINYLKNFFQAKKLI